MADAFARHAQQATDLLQRMRVFALQSVVQADDAGVPRPQTPQALGDVPLQQTPFDDFRDIRFVREEPLREIAVGGGPDPRVESNLPRLPPPPRGGRER